MKWRFFIWACLLIGYGMLKAGAPPLAVAAGIVMATLMNMTKRRKRSLELKTQPREERDKLPDVRTANL